MSLKPQHLGSLEEALLIAVQRLDSSDSAYGFALRDEVERRLGRSVASGAIYVTLDRLEQKGFLCSFEVEGLRGRPRRCYRLQGEGIQALNESWAAAKRRWQGVRWPVEESS